MAEANETIADIIAEMKRRKEMLEDAAFNAPLCYSTETMQAQHEILDEFIERFEAAYKRERGDCAKLREALKLCLRGMCRYCRMDAEARGMTTECINGCEALRQAKAALAAPPRNCDRPECATTKAAADVWRKEDGGKTAYHEWLLATATEKEGGAK